MDIHNSKKLKTQSYTVQVRLLTDMDIHNYKKLKTRSHTVQMRLFVKKNVMNRMDSRSNLPLCVFMINVPELIVFLSNSFFSAWLCLALTAAGNGV